VQGKSTIFAEREPFGPPKDIRVLGAGRFGRLAAERLTRRLPDASILVVDSREDKLQELRALVDVPVWREDAVASLVLRPVPEGAWVVPAVPVHVAHLWLMRGLESEGECCSLPVPEAVDAQVPNPFRVPEGTLYASFADFICPDSCSEPDAICTHTKKPRPGNLFEVLGRVDVPDYGVAVLRSHQLAPGVGGCTGASMRALLRAVRATEGNWLIATSCRCHGVVNALNWKRRA
jgi:hypothetical protein